MVSCRQFERVNLRRDLWRWDFSKCAINDVCEKKHTKVPLAFELKQNYPNPFNPITTIEYRLPKKTHVIIIVLNIKGELILILINEEQSSGLYQVNWYACDKHNNPVARGIYFYCLQTSGFSYSKTMVFVK